MILYVVVHRLKQLGLATYFRRLRLYVMPVHVVHHASVMFVVFILRHLGNVGSVAALFIIQAVALR